MVPSIASATEGPSTPELRMAGHPAVHYTYILQSPSRPGQRYIGHTSDLRQRLTAHNAGRVTHTRKFQSWEVKVYTAFQTEELARDFVRYLKSGSGHAFAKRHCQ